jgi:hypothetical protein
MAYFSWSLKIAKQQNNTKKGWTGFKDSIRFAEPYSTENPIPTPVEINPIPEAVPSGVQNRFALLTNRIKAHQNYTKAIGYNFGIEKTAQKVKLTDVEPILNASLIGDRVVLKWRKGSYSGIVIEKDSGNSFVMQDKTSRPRYTDKTPLPSDGNAALWSYQAMFLYKDKKIGNWSSVVTIIVGGY